MRGEPGRGLWEDRCRQRPADEGKGTCKGPEGRTQFRPVRGQGVGDSSRAKGGGGANGQGLEGPGKDSGFHFE